MKLATNIEMQDGIADCIDQSLLFNELAGKSKNYTLDALKNQLELIEEEVKELRDALEVNDVLEALDAVVDIQVVLTGMQQLIDNSGVDVAQAMRRVAENNLTKFTDSLQIAELTVADLKEKGIEARIEYNSEYNLYCIKDTNNKIRKPVDYKSVVLDDCLPPKLALVGFPTLQ